MKKLAFAFALVAIPAMAFAQNSGVVVRDPTGGATRDPALGAGAVEAPPEAGSSGRGDDRRHAALPSLRG